LPDEAIPWSFKYKFDATLGFLTLWWKARPVRRPGFPREALGWRRAAHVAQLAEHVLGKDEVTGSIPVMGSVSLRPARKIQIKKVKRKRYG
jgi:hypothetical protein